MQFNKDRKWIVLGLTAALLAGIIRPADAVQVSAATSGGVRHADNIGRMTVSAVNSGEEISSQEKKFSDGVVSSQVTDFSGGLTSVEMTESSEVTSPPAVTESPEVTTPSAVTESPGVTSTVTAVPTIAPVRTDAPQSTLAQTPAATGAASPDVTTPPAATVKPSAGPTATPDNGKYVLLSPKAKYKKGKLKGIHYKKLKNAKKKKVYRITSYTTDTVRLKMSRLSRFEVDGAGKKSDIKKKYIKVSSSGKVRYTGKKKEMDQYALIKATCVKTKEVKYIYICFKKKLKCQNKKNIVLYENAEETLKFNYAKSKLVFSVSNKKAVKINKKGKVTALKKGKSKVTARVRDSQKNLIQFNFTVKIEPWIVSAKDKLYDYDDMTGDLSALKKNYGSKVDLTSLGTSYDNRKIWCLRIGRRSAPHKLVIDSSIHAREWLNTQILMRQTEEMLRSYRDYKERFKNTCLYIVPMDNPDGVAISQYGFSAIRNEKLRKICEKAGHADVWKANARGVNLNNNFPAGFVESKERKPHYMAYNGKKAASEKETKILMKLVESVNPDAVLNLHSTGSILYWDFDVEGKLYEDIHELASKINSFNNYPLMPKSGSTSASGGMADWVVYEKRKVSVTIETGTVPCPLPHSQYKSIYKRNRDMFLWFMTEY